MSPLGILGAARHSGNVRRDKEMTSSISPDLFAAWLSRAACRPRARRHILDRQSMVAVLPFPPWQTLSAAVPHGFCKAHDYADPTARPAGTHPSDAACSSQQVGPAPVPCEYLFS